ncbi:class I SAM-dependent methyltransferase [Bacteroidota bacterium]
MIKDKNKHWYDGWIYERFIAKHVDKFSDVILSLIDENKNILDVGCGTGRLTLSLAPKCRTVTGIDLSSKNIAIAESNMEKSGLSNVDFICSDVAEIEHKTDKIFDYAILSFVIHEVPIELRSGLIKAVKR